ncbi:PREDICTED: uncharacterized protein LOC104822338 [Tarenaya hassleriana]|uniref:uncharacterized protein LOC104822338 n=1 Tax=Tarenaya hassleriana TaxID=28532 RepID=UPI00053C5AA9|nr:PREDICTED: uncharacterized protein LOC104822338 [Tarenaya hassleriana]
MESSISKNTKPGTPAKDSTKFQSTVQDISSGFLENSNPNVSYASPARSSGSPITKSAGSPLVKSAKSQKSAQKNLKPNLHPNPAGFSPRNRIRERRFVVAKKNSQKERRDAAAVDSAAPEVECKCGAKSKGNMKKCLCVAYENLRASQEEFFKKRSETEEAKGDLDCSAAQECDHSGQDIVDADDGYGEEPGELGQIGMPTMKRRREKLLEQARQSVPESGKVMHLVEAFEKLSCLPLKASNNKEEHQTEETVKKPMKWELPGMRQPPKVPEAETDQVTWISSFCPSDLVLTAENLGLDPCASVSSSWDSSRSSISSRSSNGARRSRRNSLESSGTTGSRQLKKKPARVTSLKPFKLNTEQRGKMKEEEFSKKLQEMMIEEEKMRIPIAQGLPWTTDEPECLMKPPVKEITKPVDLKLHSDIRAAERAEFDHQVAEKMCLIEQYKMERERQQKLAEEEELRRLRKELIPKAQPMPYFDRPFIPRRSMKHPTIPREPRFHLPQQKKIRCGSVSSSWSETGSYTCDLQDF